ncbi:MBL fold metallo-hydrolase [Winogradskyella sp.]|uniref:MBL fold metallo-hydrolase n=1 Tax=Winogradskyella sp. TaxID=1883156 RepID=UPI003510D92E
MKFLKSTLTILFIALLFCCKNENKTPDNGETDKETEERISSVKVIPISHGTLILETESDVIYVDPTGGAKAFNGQKAPTIVLVTDIHGDHLNLKTLKALNLNEVPLVAPKAVADKIQDSISATINVLNNGESTTINAIEIEAIPMYNLREEALKFHPKGRGNGYVLNMAGERVYISGDTEDIPEMRSLKDIDKAFVCMNLPYTMTVQSAADAVLEFKPETVYPYHYRGSDSISDVNLFKKIVNEGNDSIEVLLLEWY